MIWASSPIRPAAAAGRFYPAQADALRRMLRDLEAQACNGAAPTDGQAIKALIAPHAGYPFSGPVAASVYRLLRGRGDSLRRVVLFGPAHYEAFAGLAVPSSQAFATPLGDVPVDREAVDRLRAMPFVQQQDSPHGPEHALEVQLPFLIDVLGGAGRFAIVPLLFAEADDAEAEATLSAVWGDEQTLVVISSDLSHYHSHADATRRDRATAEAIVEARPQAIGPEQACGYLAVRAVMRMAERFGLHCACLDLRNSGDTAPQLGGRDRVVGYGAFVYTG